MSRETIRKTKMTSGAAMATVIIFSGNFSGSGFGFSDKIRPNWISLVVNES